MWNVETMLQSLLDAAHPRITRTKLPSVRVLFPDTHPAKALRRNAIGHTVCCTVTILQAEQPLSVLPYVAV